MKVVELYESGLSAKKIGKKLNISTYKVLKLLKEESILVLNKQNIIKYDIGALIKSYNDGKTLTEISDYYEISIATVSKVLKKNGVIVTNYHNASKFNHNIFDIIDMEEKAYWLGFIYADGYVSNKRNEFELSLSLKDEDHLIKFANFIGYPGNVKKDTYRCRFQITNKHFKENLMNLGVIPQKSLKLTFPNTNIVPEHLIKHFIRGYFDGDGTILTKETSCCKLRISLLGTESFLIDLLKIVEVNKKIYKAKSKAYYFSLAIKNSKKFCEFIYTDSNISLTRKFNLYKKYCRSIQK